MKHQAALPKSLIISLATIFTILCGLLLLPRSVHAYNYGTVVFICDDYVAGSEFESCWVQKVIDELGLTKYKIVASDEAGFIGAKKNSNSFMDLLDNPTLYNTDNGYVKSDVSWIIVVGGKNDRTANYTDITNAIAEFAEEAGKRFHNAKIAVGMAAYSSKVATQDEYNNVLRAYKTITSQGGCYIDNIESALKENNGINGDASDAINSAGQQAIGKCVATYIKENINAVTEDKINVNINWKDSDNAEGARPNSLRFSIVGKVNNVQVTDEEIYEIDASNTAFQLGDKDFAFQTSSGDNIKYEISVNEVPGYTVSVESKDGGKLFIIRMVHAISTKTIGVDGLWDDENNRDGIRPESIDIDLVSYANGQEIKHWNAALISTESGFNTQKFTVPEYYQGSKIEYKLMVNNVSGYDANIEEQDNGFFITMSYKPQKSKYKIKVFWDDNNNSDGNRPQSISVKISGGRKGQYKENGDIEYAVWISPEERMRQYNETYSINYVITADDNWEKTTRELYTYDAGFFGLKRSREEEDGSWRVLRLLEKAGLLPSNVTISSSVALLDVDLKKVEQSKKLTREEKDEIIWAVLASKTKSKGKEIDYKMELIPDIGEGELSNENCAALAAGYSVSIEKVGYTFNVYMSKASEVTDVTLYSIMWDDDNNIEKIRPESITVSLNGQSPVTVYTNREYGSSINVWRNMPVYKNGNLVDYNLTGVEIPNYAVTIMPSGKYGFALKYTHKAAKRNIHTTVKWEDNDNEMGLRPSSVKLILSGTDGSVVEKEVQSTESGVTFYNLPSFDTDGEYITYKLTESGLTGYEVEIAGGNSNARTVTNRIIGFDTTKTGRLYNSRRKLAQDGYDPGYAYDTDKK